MNIHIFGRDGKRDKNHLNPGDPKAINKIVKELNTYFTNRGFGPLERIPVIFNVLEQLTGTFRIFLRDRSTQDQLKVFEEIKKLADSFAEDIGALIDTLEGEK